MGRRSGGRPAWALAVPLALVVLGCHPCRAVTRQFGLPDCTVAAGHLFNYTIPKDSFTGGKHRFEVAEAGERQLPRWMQFESPILSGVPLAADIGQHYISVKAIAENPDDEVAEARDVFSVDVVEHQSSRSNPELPAASCPAGNPVAMATVTVDADANDLRPHERARLLTGLAHFLEVPVAEASMAPMAPDEPAYDNSALMAGAGDSPSRLTAGLRLRWRVGCSSDVEPHHAAALKRLEASAEDGSLARLLGHPVVGWHVSSVQPTVRRARAHSHYIGGTPLVPAPLPTVVATETGNIVGERPMATPETRIVPTMASPVFDGPTVHHPHRHHHGEDHHARHIAASPTLSSVVLPTAALGMTPVLPPLRPTQTSFVDGAFGEVTPTFGPELVQPTSVGPEVSATPALPTPETPRKPAGGNTKPTLNKRLPKLKATAGNVWTFQIPADAFHDREQGDTRELKLMFLTSAGTAIEPRSWIQFDAEKQTLSALPLDEHIGKYQFRLEAMDNEGETVHDLMDINVWQHSSARAVHHKFRVTLKPKNWEYANSIDWQIKTVQRLARFFGDPDTSQVTVQNVSSEPVSLTWTNDSLPKHPCPREQLMALYDQMADASGSPLAAFKKALGNLKVQKVSVEFLGVCPPASSAPPPLHNKAPTKRNSIGQINATVGEILRYIIPDDTFYDFEDGTTRYLTLSFLSMDGLRLPESSWVQFNPRTQELYGLPFDGDVRRHEFQLVAQDSFGMSVEDVFVVLVQPRAQKKWAVEFSLHLDEDFEAFSRNISRKVLVAWKLARLYGDPDPRYVTVNTISAGSVVYAWTNNTLPYEPCPTETIRQLMSRLVHDNRTLTQRLVDEMKPEFRILKADTMPLGLCMDKGLPSTSVLHTAAPPPAAATPEVGDASDVPPADDDIYITTIIPAVVIAVMLLLAALVACMLYRKKRKGKLSMQDSSTFINKGIPIIFADELEDKPDPAKPPVIMKEERPPLPPPEYPRGGSSSRGSTPQTGRRLPRDDAAPYQHPTPPFVSGRPDRQTRPKAAPTYRQPPPYVPP
uniref:Dystroglycan 1 n=2 Tax=Ixodes ricinus TaxID=34613 RepID=V5H8L8_IXORI